MSLICYTPKNFTKKSLIMINQANDIIADYRAQGYSLTVRQLYYQFVARDLIPNNMASYNRLKALVNNARLAGYIDWEAIVDRTRNLKEITFWNSPAHIVESCANQFKIDMWENQKYRPEVWIEKDALMGVIERACRKWRVPYFACRGYNSQSEAWNAGQRMINHLHNGQKPYIIHLGDHDPSGIDMTRDNDERAQMFVQQESYEFEVQVRRLALNHDQVRQYRPPPNPAKEKDSRSTGYIEKFGKVSWELDALEPTVINQLIEDQIRELIDFDEWNNDERIEQNGRDRLREVADELEREADE